MSSIVLYQAVQGLQEQEVVGESERLLLRTTISNQQSALTHGGGAGACQMMSLQLGDYDPK